jgi:hypothetical protein
MTHDEFCSAVEEAEITERRANMMVEKTARMCRNRLQISGVDRHTLSALKCELRDWDMVRNVWRNT